MSHVGRRPWGVLQRLLMKLLLLLLHATRAGLGLRREPTRALGRGASHGVPAHVLHGVPGSHVGRKPSPRGAKAKRGAIAQPPTSHWARLGTQGAHATLQWVNPTWGLAHPWDGARPRARASGHLPPGLAGRAVVGAVVAWRAVPTGPSARGRTQPWDGGIAGGVGQPHALLHQPMLGRPAGRLCRAIEGMQ